jgi:hypothetical protein
MAGELSKDDVEAYLGSVDVRSHLEEALNGAVSALTKDPTAFFGAHYASKLLLRSMGITPAMTGPCDGLLPQPTSPLHKVALVEYNVPGDADGVGGADKGKNGHRVDSIPICNGVIKTGSVCFPIKCASCAAGPFPCHQEAGGMARCPCEASVPTCSTQPRPLSVAGTSLRRTTRSQRRCASSMPCCCASRLGSSPLPSSSSSTR